MTAVDAPADVSSGHGLQIIESESRAWGVLRGVDSKTVWCELDQGSAGRHGTYGVGLSTRLPSGIA